MNHQLQDDILNKTYEKIYTPVNKYPYLTGVIIGLIIYFFAVLSKENKFDPLILVVSLLLGILYIFVKYYSVNKNYPKKIQAIYEYIKNKYSNLELFVPIFIAERREWIFRSALLIKDDKLYLAAIKPTNKKFEQLESIEVKFNKDVIIKRLEVVCERIIFEGTLFDQPYKFAIYNDENVKNELLKYINFEGEQK